MEDIDEGFEDIDLRETIRRLSSEVQDLRQAFTTRRSTEANLNAPGIRRRRLNPLAQPEGSGDEGPESQEGNRRRHKLFWQFLFLEQALAYNWN